MDFRCCSHHFVGLLLCFLMYKENPLDEYKTLRLKSFIRFDAKVEKESCKQKYMFEQSVS